jgi:hypothetical protein
MKYYFKPDAFVVIISLFCLFMVSYVWMSAGPVASFSFWLAVGFSFIFLWYIVKTPLYTYIDEDVIRIRQLLGDTTFKRSEVKVRRLTPREMQTTVRTFGSGGLGGYIGFFQSQYLGRYYMLALNKKDLALVTKEDGTLFVINYPPQD